MLIQISSAQGPKECEYACYLYYQELIKKYPNLEMISLNVHTKNCLKSVILYSEEDLSYLQGTIQWICQSPFRPHHKRKNWFIDISILDEEYQIENTNDIQYEVFHSSGKGGQNVNKVSTAIRAIHIPTGIHVICQDQRSQSQNKKIAYLRLMAKLKDLQISKNHDIKYQNWNKHNQIIRGKPKKVYKGMEFKQIQ